MKLETKQQTFEFIDSGDVNYEPIHRKYSTFKSGLEKSVHNWFRLTPSFGPDLVNYILDEFGANDESIILDPFAGASTTLIECQKNNLKCYGFEVNDFLHFIGASSVNWNLNKDILEKIFIDFRIDFKRLEEFYRNLDCESMKFPIPSIHNVYRWWRKDVLKDLLIIKEIINLYSEKYRKEYKNFLNLALAGVLVPDLTNVTLGKLQLHFIDRSNDIINTFNTFYDHLEMMINDINELSVCDSKKAEIFHIDSADLSRLKISSKIDFVITSPPYPNRYSYVWNTRPFLFFFDFFNKPNQASELDKKTIGGTWGTATSILSKGVINPLNDAVDKNTRDIIELIRKEDNLMANYVIKYFNFLTKQIIEMETILSKNAKIAYVVGNSRIKGVYVETDTILKNILEDLNIGYTSSIHRFRKRNSGKDLYETIVYGEK